MNKYRNAKIHAQIHIDVHESEEERFDVDLTMTEKKLQLFFR